VNIENALWVEKYRPKKLEDLVLPETYRLDFEKCINNKNIGNLIFSGPPGSGKTTIARILASRRGVLNHPSDNLLEMNGSSKESRGINFVDQVIEPFLKIPPAGKDTFKIVFIDEADFLTDASFKSLRGIIEAYHQQNRFVLTCNYLSKIPDPVQSRFQTYMFKQMPVDFVVSYYKKMLDAEKVKYSEDDIRYVIDGVYPDVRKGVQILQQSSHSGTLKINKNISLTNEKSIIGSVIEIINYIKNDEIPKINKSVNDILAIISNEYDLDFRSIYSSLFYRSEVPVNVKIIVNKYTNSHGDCLIPSMHFMAMIFEIIKSLQDYKKLVK
jgi:replication factor C small subunit